MSKLEASELIAFQRIFSEDQSHAEAKCECGRLYFDGYNDYDAEWVKEVESFRKLAKKQPDKYIEIPHAIGVSVIDGKRFVYNCKCGGLKHYKDLIDDNAEKIIEYLRKKSAFLMQQADAINPDKQ